MSKPAKDKIFQEEIGKINECLEGFNQQINAIQTNISSINTTQQKNFETLQDGIKEVQNGIQKKEPGSQSKSEESFGKSLSDMAQQLLDLQQKQKLSDETVVSLVKNIQQQTSAIENVAIQIGQLTKQWKDAQTSQMLPIDKITNKDLAKSPTKVTEPVKKKDNEQSIDWLFVNKSKSQQTNKMISEEEELQHLERERDREIIAWISRTQLITKTLTKVEKVIEQIREGYDFFYFRGEVGRAFSNSLKLLEIHLKVHTIQKVDRTDLIDFSGYIAREAKKVRENSPHERILQKILYPFSQDSKAKWQARVDKLPKQK